LYIIEYIVYTGLIPRQKKRPVFCQKSCAFYQKSPVFYRKRDLYSVQKAVHSARRACSVIIEYHDRIHIPKEALLYIFWNTYS